MLMSACGCHRPGRSSSRRIAMATDAKAGRTDPTGLGSVRRRYERELRTRFAALKKVILEAVVKLDVLGLRGENVNSSIFAKTFASAQPVRDALAAPAPGQFRYDRNAQKVQSFMDWIRDMQRQGILEVTTGVGMGQAADASWQNMYLQSAYQKGMADAYKRAGEPFSAGFWQPIHADAAGLIYTRAYESLSGVTDVMATRMSQALAGGLIEGAGSMEIARSLLDVVEDIGEVRARMIARTELTAAYAEASLNSYAEMGLEGVGVEAEFSTANDDSVCPECEELEGQVFSITESRGLIPVHPNCRCAFIPMLSDEILPTTEEE